MTADANTAADASSAGQPRDREAASVAAAVGASIGGLLVHNLLEFPPSILVAPETVVPVAITLALGYGMLRRSGRGVPLATAAWAAVVLVVGGGSVLPLDVWPFVPEQTVGHYLAHAVYALAQVPLLWVALRALRSGREG